MSGIFSAAAVPTDVWPAFPRKDAPPEPDNIQKNLDRAIELIERVALWNPSKIYVLPEFFSKVMQRMSADGIFPKPGN